MGEQVHLNRYFTNRTIFLSRQVLFGLGRDKSLYQRVGSLCVHGQSISKRLQVGAFVQEGLFQAIATSMEKLFHRFQRNVQDCALTWI